MDPLIEYQNRWIPYRLKSVEIMNLAIRLVSSWDDSPEMEIYFDGRLQLEGKSTGFTNAAIEAGVLHSRALLDFLGLKLKPRKTDRLIERQKKRWANDIVIEDFGLSRVSVEDAVSKYPGEPDEAEASLATPIALSNSFVAHNSSIIPRDPEQWRLLEIGSRGIPALVISYFYTRKGLVAPDFHLPSRQRNEEGWTR